MKGDSSGVTPYHGRLTVETSGSGAAKERPLTPVSYRRNLISKVPRRLQGFKSAIVPIVHPHDIDRLLAALERARASLVRQTQREEEYARQHPPVGYTLVVPAPSVKSYCVPR